MIGSTCISSSLRLFYKLFPFPHLLDWVYTRSAGVRELFAFQLGGGWRGARAPLSARELAAAAGYGFEEHAVITDDGYVLGLHRIIVSDGDAVNEDLELGAASGGGGSFARASSVAASSSAGLQRAAHSLRNAGRPPVLLVHGLMQCSDAWLLGGRERALAFQLADCGYDVWLANNRGNRYSSKHCSMSTECDAFWDFSLDEFANYDVPTCINHILTYTGYTKLAYVGFSQGTAQAFAALSLHYELNSKISVFVALSPALAIRGLARSPLTALVAANLNFLHLLFGRRRMLSVAVHCQQVLSVDLFTDIIDACLAYLFAWRSDNYDRDFKRIACVRARSRRRARGQLARAAVLRLLPPTPYVSPPSYYYLYVAIPLALAVYHYLQIPAPILVHLGQGCAPLVPDRASTSCSLVSPSPPAPPPST